MKFYLHDKPVEFVGITQMGVQLRDGLGETQWVFEQGRKVYDCLLKAPVTPEGLTCLHCSWEKLVYKCGGSCNMRFNKGGCE